MTVHVGEVTSEVVPTGDWGGDGDTARPGEQRSAWDERYRVEDLLERVTRDALRTATGHGDD